MSTEYIVGSLIALFLILVIVRIVSKKKLITKENISKALNVLYDGICDKIIEYIDHLTTTGYESEEAFRKDATESIYELVWKYVNSQRHNLESMNLNGITKAVVNAISEENVKELVDKIMINRGMDIRIGNRWITDTYDSSAIEKEDNKLQAEYSNSDMYYTGEVTSNDLEPAENKIPEEELRKLNPPKEEEDITLDPNDESIEIIPDGTYIDTAGRLRDKTTGRFVKRK